jgi:signal transduction histidine kinase
MIVESFTDISLVKKAEEDIRRTAAELEKNSQALADANRKLNMMSSVTRHDIINKAMMANGYLELLAEYLTPGGESFYQITRDAIREIHRIIEFTRTYQDLGVQTPLWQDLQTLIMKIPDPGHFISVQNTAIGMYADPLLLKVFENLYDNSVRHGGTGLSAIHISTLPAGDALDLIWEDDGEGIPDDEKEKIFTRGYGKNTGFGLFIIREILGITGITIVEDGRYGKGARFILRIPAGSFRVQTGTEKVS